MHDIPAVWVAQPFTASPTAHRTPKAKQQMSPTHGSILRCCCRSSCPVIHHLNLTREASPFIELHAPKKVDKQHIYFLTLPPETPRPRLTAPQTVCRIDLSAGRFATAPGHTKKWLFISFRKRRGCKSAGVWCKHALKRQIYMFNTHQTCSQVPPHFSTCWVLMSDEKTKKKKVVEWKQFILLFDRLGGEVCPVCHHP